MPKKSTAAQKATKQNLTTTVKEQKDTGKVWIRTTDHFDRKRGEQSAEKFEAKVKKVAKRLRHTPADHLDVLKEMIENLETKRNPEVAKTISANHNISRKKIAKRGFTLKRAQHVVVHGEGH